MRARRRRRRGPYLARRVAAEAWARTGRGRGTCTVTPIYGDAHYLLSQYVGKIDNSSALNKRGLGSKVPEKGHDRPPPPNYHDLAGTGRICDVQQASVYVYIRLVLKGAYAVKGLHVRLHSGAECRYALVARRGFVGLALGPRAAAMAAALRLTCLLNPRAPAAPSLEP